MLVNVNGIYYAHVCEQARCARSAGNNAIENLCIIIIISKQFFANYQPSAHRGEHYCQSELTVWSF